MHLGSNVCILQLCRRWGLADKGSEIALRPKHLQKVMLGKHKALAAGLPDGFQLTFRSSYRRQVLHRFHGDVVLEAETNNICAQPSLPPPSGMTAIRAAQRCQYNITTLCSQPDYNVSASRAPYQACLYRWQTIWWHVS